MVCGSLAKQSKRYRLRKAPADKSQAPEWGSREEREQVVKGEVGFAHQASDCSAQQVVQGF